MDLRSIINKLLTEASKVVDAAGNPITLYHGSAGNFKGFSKDAIGANTYLDSGLGRGFYFTEIKDDAFYYADMTNNPGQKMIVHVHLNIENPLVVNSVDEYRVVLNKEKQRQTAGLGRVEMDRMWKKTNNDYIQDLGYDGIIYKRNEKMKEVVVFNPEQIHILDSFDKEGNKI